MWLDWLLVVDVLNSEVSGGVVGILTRTGIVASGSAVTGNSAASERIRGTSRAFQALLYFKVQKQTEGFVS